MIGGFMATGLPQEVWCGRCKAYTAQRSALLLITERGVETVGTVSRCDVCMDPTLPEVRHGRQ